MTVAATQFELPSSQEPVELIKDVIKKTHTEEIIIGLCGPIGTDIHFVSSAFSKILGEQFNYECIPIRLSKLIQNHTDEKLKISSATDKLDRTKKLIEGGNFLRQQYTPDILAEIAINEISVNREIKRKEDSKGGADGEFKSVRICYIIDSIKNIEELELFKLVYRDIFYPCCAA